MRKSEQVIYITLVDFLLQLLFLGLVLWVVIPQVSRQAVDDLGGADKAGQVLVDIKALLDKYPGNDAQGLLTKFAQIVDPLGGPDAALALVENIQKLMAETRIRDPKVLVDKIRALIEKGRLDQISDLPVLLRDLMERAGMGGQDPRVFLKVLEAIAEAAKGIGIDAVADVLKQMQQVMDAFGLKRPAQLFAMLQAIRQQTGVDDLSQWANLINQGKQFAAAGGQTGAPPYIVLDETTKGLSFKPGSALLNPDFCAKLENEVVARIELAIRQHGVNLIEVIGHTDGVRVSKGSREMDLQLGAIAREPYDPKRVPRAVQGSNMDLGMLRAVEVVKFLQHLRQQGRLAGIDPDTGFRAYSSGQLTTVDGRLAEDQNQQDEPARRRIEIRLTKLGVRERIQGQ